MLIKILTLAVSLIFFTTPLHAGDKELLDVLLENKTITKKQYKTLLKQSKKSKQKRSVKQKNLKKGLVFESPDGDFRFKVGGRLMVDGAFYDDDVQELGNGTEIRRARLYIKGLIYNDWRFETEFDFGNEELEVKDAYIGYTGIKSTRITLGHFKEPFSLEQAMSSNDITFIERGLPRAFVPRRSIGIGFRTRGENWTVHGGAFAEDVNDDPDDDEGFAFTGRATYAPLFKKGKTLHFGLSGTYREPNKDDNRARFRERPESHITGFRFVNTGNILDVNHFTVFGVETAGVFGPFNFQGEYMRADVNRFNGGSNLDFDGAYFYVSWFLTGELRNYKARSGEFKHTKPLKNFGEYGNGGIQASLRFSFIDLNDGNVQGGKENNVALGLNWILNPMIRLMTNYIFVDAQTATGDDNPRILSFRGQLRF